MISSATRTRSMVTAVLLAGGASAAIGADSFSNTGQLKFPRHYHTATLLGNGRVLVAAGQETSDTGSITVRSAELFDQTTGKWTATGDLAIPRKFHTAIRLENGAVLVAGGASNTNPLLPPVSVGGSERYDPELGIWTPAGPMTTLRESHTATLLPNGRVLVVGGYNSTLNPVANRFLRTAELFDPVAGTWTATGSMTAGRMGHTATLLPNGKVLVTGGANTAYLATTEIYDPALGTWTPGVSMRAARQHHTAVLLNDGTVLVSGGVAASGAVTSAELFFPDTGIWTGAGSPGLRQWNTGTMLADGKVLLTGGSSDTGVWLSSGTVYDPVNRTWTPTPKMTWNRFGNSATLLPNGKVLIAAGFYGNSLVAAELYRQSTGPYLDWKDANFGSDAGDPNIAGDMADGDKDGIPNIMEFALTGNPTVASTAVLPAVGGGSDLLELTFVRPEPADVTFIVQASSDLAVWSDVTMRAANSTLWTGTAIVEETPSGNNRAVKVQYAPPSQPAPVMYLRLAVRRS